MNPNLIKRLFSALQKGHEKDVSTLCEEIVEDQRRLATELEKLAPKPFDLGKHADSPASAPVQIFDAAPLVQIIPHEQLRRYMVLPEDVERRFARIENEYVARTRLAANGLRPRRRILLHGPSGCGKSLGAERLASAAGLPMHKVRFHSAISPDIGETASNLRQMFDDAARRPCVLFLDECDIINHSRLEKNGHRETSRVANMLLQLLEDYNSEGIVIVATNVNEMLDPALFRRFDEVIELPKPETEEIEKLLKMTVSSMQVQVAEDIHWKKLARQLHGYACAEIIQIIHNAAKRSVLANRRTMAFEDFDAAMIEMRPPWWVNPARRPVALRRLAAK